MLPTRARVTATRPATGPLRARRPFAVKQGRAGSFAMVGVVERDVGVRADDPRSFGEMLGRPGIVGIEEKTPVAGRELDPLAQGAELAAVGLAVQAEIGDRLLERADALAGIVRGAVVHDDDFMRGERLGVGAGDGFGHEAAVVVVVDDDADLHERRAARAGLAYSHSMVAGGLEMS